MSDAPHLQQLALIIITRVNGPYQSKSVEDGGVLLIKRLVRGGSLRS